ncbi:DUF397 domain-containing protein [Kitasatospora sp. SUK 42]|uniref:DUF397 domain-containing protein n=1 Tax=Kitasatospora sp. SUK 42 TaxID=1588882 RepID=UPI0018CA56D7|nr:DUF397 domain-containing protein [Kitasatospora sp. SUK 42]MBV2154118.1 DUF397 domain-containing protein [Kitasatospora sp. SUK 42]
MNNLAWTRPTSCANANNCPEVAIADGTVYVRSSLLPDAVAQLTPDEWRDLVSAIRNGEFDL